MFKKPIYRVLLVVILAVLIWWLWQGKSAALPQSKVIIGQQTFNVEIVDEPQEMIRGLSGRASLAKNHGLLFVYTNKNYLTFWMKDMNFPIDLLWIDGDKIAGMEKNMLPEPGVVDDSLKRYSSPQPVNQVLEIPAGSIDAANIKVGDIIKFDL